MQKSIPCNEDDWWDFKELALHRKMGLKEYLHDIILREQEEEKQE
jgi:hypothetical protein